MVHSKKTLLVSIIVVIAIAGALYYFFYFRKNVPAGSDIYEGIKVDNFAPSSTNPLKTIAPTGAPVEKTNPFNYENPFE